MALAASPAAATVFNLGALALGNSTPTGAIHPAEGAFSDTWNFTVLPPGNTVQGLVFNYNIPVPNSIIGLNISLFDGATLLASAAAAGTGAPGEFVDLSPTHVLTNHPYEFVVTGTVPEDRTGVYDINGFVSTTAVPELATWMMMLIGFGMVGLQIRRKHQSYDVSA